MNNTQWDTSSLANLSHDLRTPLNAIIGYSDMLVEECADLGWENISSDIQKINHAGRTLLEVIKEALDSVKIDTQTTGVVEEIIDSKLDFQIRTLMNSIIGFTEMAIEEAEAVGGDDLIPDLQKILSAANVFLDQVSEVTGVHLEPSAGKIEMEREMDSPAAQKEPTPAYSAREDCAIARRVARGNILVVDDDPMNRDVLSRYIRRLGHTVEIAENGQQAIDMIASQRFDLILLDIIMPVMDGFQVLALLKNNKSQRDIPIVIISSLDDQEHVVKGIRMGADDCLPKPFDPIILGARVEACLERKRWHDQEQEYLAIIKSERERTEHLLLQILPAPIVERMKQGETIIADSFEDVVILFADIVNFTPLTTQMRPEALVALLNDIFCIFDDLVRHYELEKIRAIGDEFVVAAGLLKSRSDGAEAVADLALSMLRELKLYCAANGHTLEVRIGIDTGPVIAGVIGSTKFSYDLWGDAINTASRMQSHGLGGRIHVTENTYLRLKDKFTFEKRGMISVKGKGEMQTYFLLESKKRIPSSKSS